MFRTVTEDKRSSRTGCSCRGLLSLTYSLFQMLEQSICTHIEQVRLTRSLLSAPLMGISSKGQGMRRGFLLTNSM